MKTLKIILASLFVATLIILFLASMAMFCEQTGQIIRGWAI